MKKITNQIISLIISDNIMSIKIVSGKKKNLFVAILIVDIVIHFISFHEHSFLFVFPSRFWFYKLKSILFCCQIP